MLSPRNRVVTKHEKYRIVNTSDLWIPTLWTDHGTLVYRCSQAWAEKDVFIPIKKKKCSDCDPIPWTCTPGAGRTPLDSAGQLQHLGCCNRRSIVRWGMLVSLLYLRLLFHCNKAMSQTHAQWAHLFIVIKTLFLNSTWINLMLYR